MTYPLNLDRHVVESIYRQHDEDILSQFGLDRDYSWRKTNDERTIANQARRDAIKTYEDIQEME